MKKLTYKNTVRSCYLGYLSQAVICNLAPLLFVLFRNNYGITTEKLGALVFVNFATQLIVDIVAVRFTDRLGYRKIASAASISITAGLFLLGILPPLLPEHSVYYGILAAVIVYAIGGGLIEVVISPIVDAMPGENKAGAMSLLHSFYCWGTVIVVLVTTIYLSLVPDEYWYILPLMWAVCPLFCLLQFLRVPLPETVPTTARTPLKTLFSSGTFLGAVVMMCCGGSSELVVSQWSPYFAQVGLKMSSVEGNIFGVCLFAVLMGTGRLLFSRFSAKIPLRSTLVSSAALCVCCYLCIAFSPWPALSLLACALCGFSVAVMWPGVLSLTSSVFVRGGAAMFGVLAIFGDLGCSVGPALTGAVSNALSGSVFWQNTAADFGMDMAEFSLKAGMLLAVIFPVAMMFIGIFAFRKKRSSVK